jgi:hypothetical protein
MVVVVLVLPCGPRVGHASAQGRPLRSSRKAACCHAQSPRCWTAFATMSAARSSTDLQRGPASYFPEFLSSAAPVTPARGTARSSIFYSASTRRRKPHAANDETESLRSSCATMSDDPQRWFQWIHGERFAPESLDSEAAYWAGYSHAQREHGSLTLLSTI